MNWNLPGFDLGLGLSRFQEIWPGQRAIAVAIANNEGQFAPFYC
jgi:hypothetical protein